MPHPSPEQVIDIVLNRRLVYDLETDSQIRQSANRLTARALFEILARWDDEGLESASSLEAFLREFPGEEPSCLIGFATRNHPAVADEPEPSEPPEPPEEPSEYYLRLVFRDEQAAYYQFSLFPDLDADYVLGASRKRAGAVQHLHVTLARPEALQTFIESCRANPHFVRVELSTADDFDRAPSHGV